MGEVVGPIIATSLVLIGRLYSGRLHSLGWTGQLYKQFALTIACSVIISTLNALTLSPALCAIFLRSAEAQGTVGFSDRVQHVASIEPGQAYERHGPGV